MASHTPTPAMLGVLLCSLLLQSCALANAAPRCDFPAIFNFGDSNSDTGGLAAAFGQTPPPNGVTFFRAPAGRCSDGRLIIDFAAESLGLPYLSAFLDSVGSNYSHGANFATAGSTVRPPTQGQDGASPIYLKVQSTQFSDFRSRSQSVRSRGGVFQELLPAEEHFARALYTFDIGQNDLTAGYKLNMSHEQVKATVPDVLDQLSRAIKMAFKDGGRSFWVHNTGPLGCLPYTHVVFQVKPGQLDSIGCARPYNDVAQYFNQRLKERVVQLRKDLPLAAITYVDVYSVKYQLISQAKEHGFEEPLRACCGQGGGSYNFDNSLRCGAKIVANGTQVGTVGSCKDPSVKISWDGIHYTEAANKWVFEQIVDGRFSDPPVPLKSACVS